MTATATFSLQRFREEREAQWQDFEKLLVRLESGSTRALSSEELLALPVLYRATLSSLSIARATSLDAGLLEYLESLAMRGYFLIYGVRESRWARMRAFFVTDWPQAVRAVTRETLMTLVIFLLGIATAWALVVSDPEWFYTFVPGDLAGGRTPEATADYLRETLFEAPPEDEALHNFATFLFTHNSRVSIMSFALGFAFGIPTAMLEFANGLTFGAMYQVFASKGLAVEFGGWLSIHGTTEILALLLSGAAGLHIGLAVLFPGDQTRLAAASAAGRRAGVVMIGVVIMLGAAALLEGFGRQLIRTTAMRYTIGAIMLAMWMLYFYAPRASDKPL